MYIVIGEGCVGWKPPLASVPPGLIPQQKFERTSRWCLSYLRYYLNYITMQIIHGAVLSNNANRQQLCVCVRVWTKACIHTAVINSINSIDERTVTVQDH